MRPPTGTTTTNMSWRPSAGTFRASSTLARLVLRDRTTLTTRARSFSYLSDANTYFSVDNLLLKLAAAYLTGAELVLFTTMIESLKQAKNESATKLFDSSSKAFKKANFQVGVAT